MNNYIPFLKLKVNEIGALATLSPAIKAKTYPFFDLPKKKNSSEITFKEMLAKSKTSIKKHLAGFPAFFLDNLDIDDSLTVDGLDNYGAVIDTFGDLESFIPVVALDRLASRNELVFSKKAQGMISSSNIAIRLQPDDFQSYAVIEEELLELQAKGNGLFEHWVIVLDNRCCQNIDAHQRGELINKFLSKASAKIKANSIIIAGSSIPASIRDILKVESECHQARNELNIYRIVAAAKNYSNIFLGDYTVVSPQYSDIEIPPEAMQNVIAAKVIYSHDDSHYIVRGGSLKSHLRGRLQYNDITAKILTKSFYRGAGYSFGDNYISEKAKHLGPGVTPGSILKPTINLHITYMLTSFPG